eukprot:312950_1
MDSRFSISPSWLQTAMFPNFSFNGLGVNALSTTIAPTMQCGKYYTNQYTKQLPITILQPSHQQMYQVMYQHAKPYSKHIPSQLPSEFPSNEAHQEKEEWKSIYIKHMSHP